MDDAKLAAIVDAIVRELKASGAVKTNGSDSGTSVSISSVSSPASAVPVKPRTATSTANLTIDLPDPTLDQFRYKPRVKNPKDANGVKALIESTTARIGVGRAGPRYNTASLLLFQGDHAVTQDALYRDVDQKLLNEFNLFTVQTKITGGKQEYLLRPDLGRSLSDEAKRTINEKCQKNVNVQLCVGDGLSAAAIEANLRQIFPVIKQGVQQAGLTFGTPFFIKYARVGVMNDIGELIKPDVVILLIGERPGLGRAEFDERLYGLQTQIR
ncbi:MAG: ethanolamine ammonia-lyase light chain EutC [Anaerolineales bacterium]